MWSNSAAAAEETEIKPASLVLFRRGEGGKLWCARGRLFSAHSASLGKERRRGGRKWKKKRENDGRAGSGVKLVCLREGREEEKEKLRHPYYSTSLPVQSPFISGAANFRGKDLIENSGKRQKQKVLSSSAHGKKKSFHSCFLETQQNSPEKKETK